MRVADYIIQRLYEEDCHHLFTVTGRGILYLTDALARHEKIKSVCVHHEQSAAYAAMAYAQMNDKMGAAMVSTGCGSTNAITGVLCAWQDNIPCIFISGQNKLHETVRYSKLPIRTYGQQEADIIAIVEPITKYATMITNPNDIVYELDKAIHYAKSGRKGPVWVDVPLDVQNMQVDPESAPQFIPDEVFYPVSSDDIYDVVESIKVATRPIILIGSGIRSANAIEPLHTLLSKSGIPAVYSSSATDILDDSTVLSIGCAGAMASNRAANFAIQNADLILVLGCRLSSMITGADITKFGRDAKIIAVDIDEYEHQKFPNKIDKIIIADVKAFLDALIKETLPHSPHHWLEKCRDWKITFPKCEDEYTQDQTVDLYHLSQFLTHYLPKESVCVSDSGLEELIIPTTVEFKKGQRCIHPAAQGAMGYALPAAIGSYYAAEKPTLVVVGDGSIMMNLQELQTIAYHQLPIKILVINNNCYAVIRKRQQDLFRTRTIGTDSENGVSCPDFEKVAHCFGIRYERINTTAEIDKALPTIFNLNEAVLCEVMAKDNQHYIHSSYKRGINGRFVQPPIEDQAPFLDRDRFLSAMIIAPIDQ